MTPPELYEGGKEPGGYDPRDWLTPTQREASENYTGFPGQRKLSDLIRAREYRAPDGTVRQKGSLKLSYEDAKRMLGIE